MTALYQLTAEQQQALAAMTEMLEAGDIDEATLDNTMAGFAAELEQKVVGVAAHIRNMEAQAKAIKDAETEMATRRKRLNSQIEWYKNYLVENMNKAEITSVFNPQFEVKLKLNPASVVIDEAWAKVLPDVFMTTKVTSTPNKKAIKQAIESGDEVLGCTLVNKMTVSIK